MYGIFTYIWLIFTVNVAIYTIHGSYGIHVGNYANPHGILWILPPFLWFFRKKPEGKSSPEPLHQKDVARDFFHIWLSEIHGLCPPGFFWVAGETWLDPWKIWRNCGKSTWEFLQIPVNHVRVLLYTGPACCYHTSLKLPCPSNWKREIYAISSVFIFPKPQVLGTW